MTLHCLRLGAAAVAQDTHVQHSPPCLPNHASVIISSTAIQLLSTQVRTTCFLCGTQLCSHSAASPSDITYWAMSGQLIWIPKSHNIKAYCDLYTHRFAAISLLNLLRHRPPRKIWFCRESWIRSLIWHTYIIWLCPANGRFMMMSPITHQLYTSSALFDWAQLSVA